MFGYWFAMIGQTDDTSLWQKDWHCLWAAGDAFLRGETNDLYTTIYKPTFEDSVCIEGYFWLYPPYALYVTALLGLFSPWNAYILVNIAVIIGFGISIYLMHKLYPGDTAGLVTFSLGFIASEPAHGVLVTGQNSAYLLATVLAGVYALQHQRWFWAALAFSVLGLKPNWVIFAVIWLAYLRHWRVVLYMAGFGGLLMLSTLPMDPSLWTDFFQSTRGYGDFVLEGYPVSKLITTHAAVRSMGFGGSAWFTPVWLLTQGVIVLSTWVVWRSNRSLMAKAGMMILLTVACNVYTNFYDAALLLVPAMAWWFERGRYTSGWWSAICISIAISWFWLWLRITTLGEPPYAPTGLFLMAWALAEAFATLRFQSTPALDAHPRSPAVHP